MRIEGEGLRQLSENPQFPPDVRAQKVDYWNKVNSGEVFLDRWVPVQTDLVRRRHGAERLSCVHEAIRVVGW